MSKTEKFAGLDFTSRSSGHTLATLRLETFISRETIEAVAKRRECSPIEAVRLIREAYADLLSNMGPMWEEDGEIVISSGGNE
jgi:hypothetical protein